jgi:hypothetical protein
MRREHYVGGPLVLTFKKFYKTAEFVHDGTTVPMLSWFEPEDDDGIIHFAVFPETGSVTHPDTWDAGSLVDLEIRGPFDTMAAAFDKMTDDGMSVVFEEHFVPLVKQLFRV